MEKILKSKKFIIIAASLVGIFIIAVSSFSMGVFVGFHKARFSNDFGKNYEKNFMGSRFEMDGPRGPMGMMKESFKDFEGRGMRNGHGIAGTIISISENNVVIKDRDGKENTISVSEKTIINLGRDAIKIGDLKNDEEIVVIGKPGDNGVVNADLIRVFEENVSNNQNNNQQ